MDYEKLKKRIAELEAENLILKSILDQAGISYSIPNTLHAFDTEKKNENKKENKRENQKAPIEFKQQEEHTISIVPTEITYRHVQKFFSYFWGRMDVFSRRYQNKTTGKTGYFPQCDNFWRSGVCPKRSNKKAKCKECTCRAWTKLEAKYIETHLRGERMDGSDVIGIYPLFPDGTCRFLVFDFDNHSDGAEKCDFANMDDSWKEEVESLRKICNIYEIPFLVERSRSGKGAHVWIFFDSPISAASARQFGFSLLNKGAESVNLKSFRFYDRMLPAQSELSRNELGNLIALPLQGQALKEGNSAFVDEHWNAYSNQWNALLSTKRLSKQKLEEIMLAWNETAEKNKIISENEDVKPWERTSIFHKEDVEGIVHIVLSNKLYIQSDNLKPRLQNQIRRLAVISNPEFFKKNAIGLSTYSQSRYIYLGEDDNNYICIPRGLLEQLREKCEQAGIKIVIEDKRTIGNTISVDFTGELRENQKKALGQLLKYENGILSAATAFGKTVTCSGIIAEKKVNTLILLESSALIEQWEKALHNFLLINEELPEYYTKTGRVKKRGSVIGIIQGAKDTSTGIIDIAMAGSLLKKGELHPRLKEYGLILVDECHHSASDTVSAVLKEATAKYVYGVTATPFRGDGLEKINYMLLGPIRYQYTAKEKVAEQGISHFVVPRFTRTVSPHGRDKMHVNDAYELIRNNDVRNEQILEDIKRCIEAKRTPVVLSRYKEHAETLYERAKAYADKVFLLTGAKSKKEQKVLRTEMDAVTQEESMILIATGQLIGEGFDFPRLDTLIMATPVAWKGIVEQYAERLNRDYEGKEKVMIYDYVDSHIPVFDRMYAKRLKSYKRIGYQLSVNGSEEKQEANAIFDSETYLPIYEKDLQEAVSSIVISSPTLGKNKVFHMIKLLKERQELGVKVTIVTWHPDAYMYGRDEHRIELLEELRNAGFHIELMQEHCEHYAVIDHAVVWYGNMNLLSKEDVEDSIMRVISKEIAAELLEITFHKGDQVQAYQLPL